MLTKSSRKRSEFRFLAVLALSLAILRVEQLRQLHLLLKQHRGISKALKKEDSHVGILLPGDKPAITNLELSEDSAAPLARGHQIDGPINNPPDNRNKRRHAILLDLPIHDHVAPGGAGHVSEEQEVAGPVGQPEGVLGQVHDA
jgi:hypothetical protein